MTTENEQRSEANEEQIKPAALIRLKKTVVFEESHAKSAKINSSVIRPEFYNAFKYELLPKDQSARCLTFGVTSSKLGDGKSLVASNMAVSFAVANAKKTLIVDLNIGRPRIHKIFNVPIAPGFLDALDRNEIRVSETPIRNLSVLSAGQLSEHPFVLLDGESNNGRDQEDRERATLGLEHVTSFRDIIYSLEQVFEVVIVDLPSVADLGFPQLYLKQISGLIVVVNSGATRKEEIDKLLHHVDEQQILGFVLNRTDDTHI